MPAIVAALSRDERRNRVKRYRPVVEIGPEMPGFILDVAAVVLASREQ